jgi:hypothetical protein
MGLFRSGPKLPSSRARAAGQIPITQVDLSKRYDIYCTDYQVDKLYENVRFLGIRTFERINDFTSGLVGGFLEIEAIDGSRWMIPSYGIQMICEHGTRPVFKILRQRGTSQDS